MARTTRRQRGRVRVNRPPEFRGGPKDGRPNTGIQHTTGGAAPEKKPFEEAFARTKDLERKEGESDADYAKRQEAFKAKRGKTARKTLRSTLGKNWGKRVYEGKWVSGQQRKSALESFTNLKERESKISDKLAKATEDAQKEALAARLETVKTKRKESGADVREFRGMRREALQSAYETPNKAKKQYPRVREFSVSGTGRGKFDGSGNKKFRGQGNRIPLPRPAGGKPDRGRGSVTTGGASVTLPGGRPNVKRRRPRK